MAEPAGAKPTTAPSDRLQRRIDELWREIDRLTAEGRDLEAEFDEMVDEEFGTPALAQALMDVVLEGLHGEGWNTASDDNEPRE